MSRKILRSPHNDDVWSELTRDGLIVHVPGLNLDVPTTMPEHAAGPVNRLRGAYVFGLGTPELVDLGAIMLAAFDAQLEQLERQPPDVQLLAVAHVLKAWGADCGWH